MKQVLKRIAFPAAILLAATLFGCGGEEGGGSSLSASVVTSSVTSSHAHTAEVPLTDISSSPASDVYQYRSNEADGHSHVIAFSKEQLSDLNNGRQVTVTSSAPSSGPSHTHDWTLRGGNLLYDKHCYRCHGDGKRGDSPMNVSFNSSQRSAVKDPASQPLSTAAAPVPDPNYTPSTTPPVLTGKEIYDSQCSGCHRLGSYDASGSPNLSGRGSQVSAKFAPSHNGISLTSQQIADVAAFLDAN